jgi:hypothetical protein
MSRMTRLPYGDQAIVDIRKLEDYCLDPAHPRGRHKARVFKEALGIGRKEAAWLRSTLLAAAAEGQAVELDADSFGRRWRMDVPATRQERHVVIRTLWMVRTGENVLRFVTCWVL